MTTPAAPDTANSVGATDDASKGGLFNSLNNTTLNTLEQAIATKATNAATSATNAKTSETNAATSATNAATSATNSATSATNAGNSATAAATSATDAANTLDAFDDRYLGNKTSDPTVDNDGNALLTGALYFKTTDNIMRVYTGSSWVTVKPTSSDQTTINAVNANATNINAVNSNSSNINAVAGNATNINAVNSNSSNINAVAGNATNINTVAGDASEINTVAGIASNVTTVAGIHANVTTVAGIHANVTVVANMSSNVNTVAGISGNITTVAGMESNITSVVNNASNINTVAGISSNVTSVANNSSNINTVAAIFEGTATYTVTVQGGVFYINTGSGATSKPALTLVKGFTYTFDVSDNTNSGHPLAFKDSGGNAYTTGVTVTGTAGQAGAKVVFAVPTTGTQPARYYCTQHGNNMGNTITTENNDIAEVLTISSEITTVAGISNNVTTVAGISANVTSVANNSTNINTVATNITNVNAFANTYFIGSSAPTGGTVGEGDLWYDTANNEMKVHNGSSFVTFISTYDTDDLSEGSSNLYYTNTRADARITNAFSNAVSLGNNLTIAGELRGPATFVIDPAVVGNNTGTVQVKGNLQVDGTTTTVNSTTVDVADKNITVAKNSNNAAAANGAGLTVDCGSDTDATFTYTSSDNSWNVNKNLNATIGTAAQPNITSVGTLTGLTVSGDVTLTGANYNVVWDKSNNALRFSDSAKLEVGSGPDFRIAHYGASNDTFIENMTNGLRIYQYANNEDVTIYNDNSLGGTTPYIVAHGSSGEVRLAYYGGTRFATKSTGAKVTGDLETTADIELGHASDTTIARASAGVVTIEGNTVLTTGNSDTPTTTTSSSDADFVLVDDGGTMKKITPANLGVVSNPASQGFAVAMAIAL